MQVSTETIERVIGRAFLQIIGEHMLPVAVALPAAPATPKRAKRSAAKRPAAKRAAAPAKKAAAKRARKAPVPNGKAASIPIADRLLNLLSDGHVRGITGMADALECSRASVRQAVKTLAPLLNRIPSMTGVKGPGYALRPPSSVAPEDPALAEH